MSSDRALVILTVFIVIGTFILIYFAYRQIKAPKIESKKRKLDNIIEWANKILGWEYSTALREPISMNPHILYKNYASVLLSEERFLSYILRNGTRMSNIASEFKDKTLNEIINKLIEEMSTTIQELKSYINEVTPRPEVIYRGFEPPDSSKLKEQKRKQDELAKKLIDTVNEIIPNYY